MSKLLQRILIFALGIPFIIFIIWLPFFNHIAIHLLICIFSFAGAFELYNMFSKKYSLLPKWFVLSATVAIPVSGMIYSLIEYFSGKKFSINSEIYTYTLIAVILLSMFVELLNAKDFTESNSRISFSSFIILYCGYLISFISRLAFFWGEDYNFTTPLIACFVLMVFLCDSLAWFFGVLFGKNNRGFIKASPNKSIVGFFGGFLGSVCGGIISYFIWPNIFEGSILKIIIIGLIVAFSSIVGDLIESIFKRSSDVKDSGNIVPGRGGALDSIDSLLMSAPIFYLLISIFYKF